MTVRAWLDHVGPYNVNRHPCPAYAGQVSLNAPRSGVLHTTEGGFAGSESVFERHYAPHFLLGLDSHGNPRIDQLVPIGACGMACVGNNALAIVQIEMVGFSQEKPWLPDHKTLDLLAHTMVTLEAEYGIPLSRPWPDGDWGRAGDNPHRHAGKLGKVAGWYGHGDMPHPPSGESHWDPGNLEWERIFAYCRAIKASKVKTVSVEAQAQAQTIDPRGVVHVGGAKYYNWQLQNAKMIHDYFLGKLSPSGHKLQACHAAAFVEMADAESSFTLDIWGDSAVAYGWWQLHPDRLGRACKALGLPVPTPLTGLHGNTTTSNPLSAQQQLDVAWADITSKEEHAFKALEKLLMTTDPFESGVTLCRRWERAGAFGAMQKRGNGAKMWFDHFATLSA